MYGRNGLKLIREFSNDQLNQKSIFSVFHIMSSSRQQFTPAKIRAHKRKKLQIMRENEQRKLLRKVRANELVNF